MPTSVVVATSRLVECWKVTSPIGGLVRLENARSISGQKVAFGWFDVGRYAWELVDIQQLPVPSPAKGQQGFWNWDAPIFAEN
ncbi:hypothetical protein [Paenibacillus sp. SI8]|uniref:hypothetical protein n=1 Tax=unclassified Paenibacillus TaxID=185978 RepID=UPI003466D45B